jgi:hypothetical protein
MDHQHFLTCNSFNKLHTSSSSNESGQILQKITFSHEIMHKNLKNGMTLIKNLLNACVIHQQICVDFVTGKCQICTSHTVHADPSFMTRFACSYRTCPLPFALSSSYCISTRNVTGAYSIIYSSLHLQYLRGCILATVQVRTILCHFTVWLRSSSISPNILL